MELSTSDANQVVPTWHALGDTATFPSSVENTKSMQTAIRKSESSWAPDVRSSRSSKAWTEKSAKKQVYLPAAQDAHHPHSTSGSP